MADEIVTCWRVTRRNLRNRLLDNELTDGPSQASRVYMDSNTNVQWFKNMQT